MSNSRHASQQPSPRKRTLQIRLGRSKPPSTTPLVASDHVETGDKPSNAALRISLKRKSSLAGHTRPSFPRQSSYLSQNDDDDEDDDDEAVDDQDANDDDDQSLSGSEDHDDDQEDGDDDPGEEEDETEGVDRSANPTTTNPYAGVSRRPIKKLRAKGLYDALPKLIENLIRRDSYKFFCEPVNPQDVPTYLDVIQDPMDFGTMRHKVQTKQYSHMDQFKAHFSLVIRNAQTFNPPGTLYYNEAKRLGSWGLRAIEREGMAVNDNGRAGVKAQPAKPRVSQHISQPDQAIASAEHVEAQPSLAQPRYSLNVGVEAVMSAARLKPQARQRAAAALGLTPGSLAGRDSAQPMDINDDEDGVKAEDDDMDEDDSEDERNDLGRASVVRDSRERSQTLDVGGSSHRLGSSQPGGTPSTPSGYRLASPDALRRRLAAVTGTPVQTNSHPSAPVIGASKWSKQFKLKHRLGAPGTPKRLAAIGSATPNLIAPQTLAALAQPVVQSSATSCSFEDDGSINPENIEDLQSYITIQSGARPVLMPTIESLHPVAFVPNEHSGKVTTGKVGDDGDDDEDDDEKGGNSKDKGDRDPLATLPTFRPGAPDALYSAIAPEPEEFSSNFSHDPNALPSNLRNLPFHIPSQEEKSHLQDQAPRFPSMWINAAYEEALLNDRKPKKQRDREREKEREMGDDWTYFRPRLSRLLELTDLGPTSLLMTQDVDARIPMSTDLLSSHRLTQLRADLEKKACGTALASHVHDTYQRVARQSQSLSASEKQTLGQRGCDVLDDLVYGGVMGKAYSRSLAEFVAGAITSPFLTDSMDDARLDAQQAEQDRQEEVARSFADIAQSQSAHPDETSKIKEIGSRRGPFLWRDNTEDAASIAEDVPEETRSPSPDRQSTVAETVAMKHAELQPLDRGLLQYVQEEVMAKLTGNTIDILHLVAAHLDAKGCPMNVDDILERLLHQSIAPHSTKGDAATLESSTLPFEKELGWLVNEPGLSRLLDEA